MNERETSYAGFITGNPFGAVSERILRAFNKLSNGDMQIHNKYTLQ